MHSLVIVLIPVPEAALLVITARNVVRQGNVFGHVCLLSRGRCTHFFTLGPDPAPRLVQTCSLGDHLRTCFQAGGWLSTERPSCFIWVYVYFERKRTQWSGYSTVKLNVKENCHFQICFARWETICRVELNQFFSFQRCTGSTRTHSRRPEAILMRSEYLVNRYRSKDVKPIF